MSTQVASVIGLVFAIAATVLALIFITPESRRKGQNKFLSILADIFNFRGLLVEYIIKVLYIFCTLYLVFYGFFLLFSWQTNYWTGEDSYNGFLGLAIMVLGPIIIRISFEFFMMFILLVKNVIQINNKLEDKGASNQASPFTSPTSFVNNSQQTQTQSQPTTVYCNKCGTAYDPTKGGCPYGCIQ